MSWPGPMGMCCYCGILGRKHKYTCKTCGKETKVVTNSGGDYLGPCCGHCLFNSECPEPDEEDIARRTQGNYIWVFNEEKKLWECLPK